MPNTDAPIRSDTAASNTGRRARSGQSIPIRYLGAILVLAIGAVFMLAGEWRRQILERLEAPLPAWVSVLAGLAGLALFGLIVAMRRRTLPGASITTSPRSISGTNTNGVPGDLHAAYLQLRAQSELINQVLLVTVADDRGRIRELNQGFADALGFGKHELLGKSIASLHAAEIDEAQVRQAREFISNRRIWRGEVPLRHHDGHTIWLDLSFVPELPADGAVKRITAVAIDVSSRRLFEQQLRDSELRHRELFRASPQAMVLLDFNSQKILAVNQAMGKLGGYQPEELIGQHAYKLLDPIDHEAVRQRYLQVQANPELDCEYRLRLCRKDGDTRIAEVSARTVQYAGRMVRLVSVRDITEQHLGARFVAQQHKVSQAIREVLTATMLGKKVDQAFTPFVTAALELTESACVLIAEQAIELNGPDAELRVLAVCDQRSICAGIGTGDTLDCQQTPYSMLIDATEPVLLSGATTGFRNFAGIPLMVGTRRVGMLCLFDRSDDTGMPLAERFRTLIAASANLLLVRQLETARRASDSKQRDIANRLEMATDLAGIGVYEWDFENGRSIYNERTREMFALSAREFEDSHPAILRRLMQQRIVPEDRERMRQHFIAVAKDPIKHADIRYALIRPDGGRRDLHSVSNIYRDPNGKIRRVVGVLFDETSRLSYERSENARITAEIANREKTLFLSRMSHELRTPLNAILGFAQLLALDDQGRLGSDQLTQIGNIQTAGWHLLSMINEILDLSRIESGAMSISPEPIGVEAAVADAIVLESRHAADHDISLLRGRRLPEQVSILVDPTRMRQILLNLLSNAIKYNRPGGHVELECSLGEGRVCIRVRDSGRGLSPEQQARLFTPFDRLGVDSEDIEGTGIGLVITRALVELMGGVLSLSSEAGKGSCFVVSFPVLEPESAPPTAGLPIDGRSA